MNKKILVPIIYAMFLMTFFIGCKPEDNLKPLASTISDFTYEISNNGYAPANVPFTNISINSEGYLWDFGNGITSNEENPTATFETGGIYSVKLTCVAKNEVYYNQLTKIVNINIKDPNAGNSNLLYFTDRSTAKAHFIDLSLATPLIQNFTDAGLLKPYGIAVDAENKKVYITDSGSGLIYRTNSDGSGQTVIVDFATIGLTGLIPYGIVVVNDKIYWAREGAIDKANLDGTGYEVAINFGTTTAPELPLDLEFDYTNNKFYFVNDKYDFPNGGLWSVNLDGTGLTEVIAGIDATALGIDFVNGKMYFAAYGSVGTPVTENGIYMSNIDGSNIVKIGSFGSKATWGIAIDNETNKLFWSFKVSNLAADGKIIRANLDGTSQEDWITGISPHAMVVAKVKL